MRRSPLVGGAAVLGALAISLAGSPAHATGATESLGSVQPNTVRACAQPAKVGWMACQAIVRTDVGAKAFGAKAGPTGLGAKDIVDAYGLKGDGSGQTVAIVDAQDDPNAEKDLDAYRQQYNLGKADFKKVNEKGQASPLPKADAGWATEISLDLDMVSAVAPKAKILLVEADQPSMDDLGAAVNTAVKMGAKMVSNSYGGSEDGSEKQADDKYFKHPGVAITVSSGDNGYGAEYPATSQYVTAVGGTSLKKGGSAWTESAWNGAGSGCSKDIAKPKNETDVTGGKTRCESDVSAVADPQTGVAVYDTYQEKGWMTVGGTSASSPIIAGVYALAGAPGASDMPVDYVWKNAAKLTDVTSGSNGSCDVKQQCNAGKGWDGPTGLGTPKGVDAFKA